MVVLEREDRARARGARDLRVDRRLRLDLRRIPPRPDGAGRREIVRAIGLAIERSGRPPDEIGYVNYHGTSTVLNDAVESRCVREVFGGHAERLAGIVGEIDDRAPAGRERRGRRRDGGAGAGAAASFRRRSTSTIPIRRATSISSRTPGARPVPRPRCATASGFGSKNSALVIGAAL